jgi:hypothetical protein
MLGAVGVVLDVVRTTWRWEPYSDRSLRMLLVAATLR